MAMDWRAVENGSEIPRQNYCDQPYTVITEDGNWLCVLTTGPGLESRPGQHIVAAISEDRGQSWSELIDVEPSSEQMTSWATVFTVPGGRVYAIYNYESEPGVTQHGGWLCYRYSDDYGRTWSPERYRIPLRFTNHDRRNVSGGAYQFFWCIDKPVTAHGGIYFAIPKLLSGLPLWGGESWVVHSPNVLTERDPNKITWALLPEGDEGIHSPALGNVQEEQNLEVLSDGTLYMVLRTEIGIVATTLSRDRGATWTTPQALAYPDGRAVKNPRACPKIWKASNGNFVLWFHNNGAPGWGNSAVRNPVWLTGGVEVDTLDGKTIRWAEPEILLYSADPTLRGMSYPDFVEQDGRYWVTETEKVVARVHEIDPALLEGLWAQHERASVSREGLVYESDAALSPGNRWQIPALPSLRNGGFTLELWLEVADTGIAQSILTSEGQRHRGFQIATAPYGAVRISLSDARHRHWLDVVDGALDGQPGPGQQIRSMRAWTWESDRGVLKPGMRHHLVFIVDGLAKIVSIVANGRLCDGGADRIQGWSRLNPWMDDINDEGICQVADEFQGRIHHMRLYNRYLRTSEAIANWRAGI
jgi:hypothetical protein